MKSSKQKHLSIYRPESCCWDVGSVVERDKAWEFICSRSWRIHNSSVSSSSSHEILNFVVKVQGMFKKANKRAGMPN